MGFSLLNPGAAGLKSFSAGYAFRAGDVPAGMLPSCDLPGFQAAVLNRWPDGSLRFALLSGQAQLAAAEQKFQRLSVRAESAPTPAGPAVPTIAAPAPVDESRLAGIQAVLGFQPFGEVRLQDLVGRASRFDAGSGRWTAGRVRTLVSGPGLASWLYFSPIAGHAHLAAWFEVRVHASGDVEILPWIENGWLQVAQPNSFSGTLSFSLAGEQRMAQALTLPNHARTAAIQGAPEPYRVSSAGFAELLHRVDYLQETRQVPSYFSGVNEACIARQPRSFQPLAQLGFPAAMGSGGYSPSIGLLPEWDVCYLAGGAEARTLATVMAHGLAAGRYGIHYRDSGSNQPLAFSAYPHLCLGDSPALGIASTGSSSKNEYTPAALGQAPPTWTSSHHPSVGYLAYLLSAWFYFAEEVQFSATLHYLKQTDLPRQGSTGLLLPNVGANATRGAAWALRTLAQAVAVTPDSQSTLREELLRCLSANISAYHALYIAQPNNPQGICAPYTDYVAADGLYEHAMWMEDFLTAAFGHIKALRLPLAPSVAAQLDAFFAWKAGSVVGRLGPAGEAGAYHFCDAAQYNVTIAPSDTPDFQTGKGPWYASWGQIYTATLGKANVSAATDQLRGAYFPDASSYWGNLQPALVYAVEHGAPGASVAYQRMRGAGNWPQFLDSARNAPVWALRPWNQT